MRLEDGLAQLMRRNAWLQEEEVLANDKKRQWEQEQVNRRADLDNRLANKKEELRTLETSLQHLSVDYAQKERELEIKLEQKERVLHQKALEIEDERTEVIKERERLEAVIL
mmetsp:Transcript_37125/g.56965  ORF Transcript_37125/g.56965 Transcript_37125/m.56965 type:complete len:112 (+) Transcript_37125:898-1233(+)